MYIHNSGKVKDPLRQKIADLFFTRGYTASQIAKKLNLTLNHVNVQIYRLRKIMQAVEAKNPYN